MRSLKALIIAVFAVPAYAGLLPSVDDIPIIRSDDPHYSTAAYNFQKALFLQTGITARYNMLSGYIDHKADQYGRHAQEDTANWLDHETPIPSKYVFSGAALIYMIGYKRHLTKSFRNPIFPTVEHSFDVSPDGGSTTIKIGF